MSINILKSKLPIRIYYEDTDAGGVVYYANYLKFFERGRTEFLRELSIEQDVLLEKNIAFVVRKVEMECLKPAYFNQQLVVHSHLIQCKKASLIFQQQIFSKEQQLLCSCITRIACVNMQKLKPIAIPTEIIKELTSAR